MVSDGVTDIGDEWIMDVINSEKYDTAKDLSRLIVKTAVYMRKEYHDDDITAAVIKISKNTR